MKDLIRVGIVGGVASGKSAVAAALAEFGVTVVDADAVARDVLTDAGVIAQLAGAYGRDILDDRGAIDRRRLADAAFGPPPNTAALNEVVHPEVVRRARALEPEKGLVVWDAPLLLEAGLADHCDVRLFVDTPEAVRRARAGDRGWTEEEWERREASQASLAVKQRACHVMVDNGASFDETKRQLAILYDILLPPSAGGHARPAEAKPPSFEE